MPRNIDYLPKIAIFLAGIAAGALTSARSERSERSDRGERSDRASGAGVDSLALQELKTSLSHLESRLTAQDAASAARFKQVETRLEEHAAKLAEVPSTAQIVAAMEQLLSRTMTSLDDRLSTQAHSIEVLKTTVSQTDSLLERVLESLDSLQSYTDPGELSDDLLLSRPA
jgi:chromosome segregation ATPase